MLANSEIIVRAYKPPHWPHGVAIEVCRRITRESGRVEIQVLQRDATDISERDWQFNQVNPFQSLVDATVILDERSNAPQVLMDSLWGCGIRPTEGSGSAGALAATQAHVESLRTLAYHLAGVTKEVTSRG